SAIEAGVLSVQGIGTCNGQQRDDVVRVDLDRFFAKLNDLCLIVLVLIDLKQLQVGLSESLRLRELFFKIQEQRDFRVYIVFRVNLLKRLILGTSRLYLCEDIRDQPPDKDNTQRQNDSCLHLVLLNGHSSCRNCVSLYQKKSRKRQVF